jgi:hypothetical protein
MNDDYASAGVGSTSVQGIGAFTILLLVYLLLSWMLQYFRKDPGEGLRYGLLEYTARELLKLSATLQWLRIVSAHVAELRYRYQECLAEALRRVQ